MGTIFRQEKLEIILYFLHLWCPLNHPSFAGHPLSNILFHTFITRYQGSSPPRSAIHFSAQKSHRHPFIFLLFPYHGIHLLLQLYSYFILAIQNIYTLFVSVCLHIIIYYILLPLFIFLHFIYSPIHVLQNRHAAYSCTLHSLCPWLVGVSKNQGMI